MDTINLYVGFGVYTKEMLADLFTRLVRSLMADEELFKILRQSPIAWNEARTFGIERNEQRWITPDLTGADFGVSAELSQADLSNVDFSVSKLLGARFHGTDLTEANLTGADLTESQLLDTNLKGARLRNTILEGANLRMAKNYILDGCYVRNAQFNATAKDPWSVLRRTYTGPAMIWTVMALISAFVPYVAKALYWVAMNNSQMNGQLDCGDTSCDEYSVFQLMMGFDKGFIFWIIPVTLLTYNFMRGYLTWKIAPMRDEEERSGVSPGWHSYKRPYEIHLVVWYLGWLALAVFIYNAHYWLSQTVWIPASS